MVLRDRNHASIVMWSLGNESGFGRNHHAMKKRILELDDTRPIHYEGDYENELATCIRTCTPAWTTWPRKP